MRLTDRPGRCKYSVQLSSRGGALNSLAITVSGIRYRSVKEASEHLGVRPGLAARRLRDGWIPEEAFGLLPHKHAPWPESRCNPVHTSQGSFPTRRAAGAHFGVNEAVLNKRLNDGWSADEALGIVPRVKPPKVTVTVQCAGEAYPNIEALASTFSKPYKLVYKRIRTGWTPEQAVGIEEPPPRFRDPTGKARPHPWKHVIEADGRSYPGAAAGNFKLYVITNCVNGRDYVGLTTSPLSVRLRGHIAASKRGDRAPLYHAMRKYGPEAFSIALIRNDATSFPELQQQEAEEIARRGTRVRGYNASPGGEVGTSRPIVVAGIAFPSQAAAAAYHGVEVGVFNLRLGRLGWTPEEAAGLARPKFARRTVEVAGRTFPSLKAASAHFGLRYKSVYARVTRFGWSIEQALGIEGT